MSISSVPGALLFFELYIALLEGLNSLSLVSLSVSGRSSQNSSSVDRFFPDVLSLLIVCYDLVVLVDHYGGSSSSVYSGNLLQFL